MFVGMEKSLEAICSRMTPDTLEKYTSLYNSHKTDGSGPLTGIGRTNGFDVGVEDPLGVKLVGQGKARYSTTGALSSRLNHRCAVSCVSHAYDCPHYLPVVRRMQCINLICPLSL